MKILEVTRSYKPVIGGLENFVFSRNKIFHSLNYRTQIITTDYQLTSTNCLEDEIVRFKQFSRYNVIYPNKKFLDILKESYDIISINQIGNFLSDFFIFSKNPNNPIKILTPHMYFHTSKYGFAKKIYSGFITKKLLRKIDHLICFTKVEAKFWNKYFEFPLDKITIIPHSFNFINKIQHDRIEDHNFILYIGRKAINKRIDLLIEAWNNLNINKKLIIVGVNSLENHKNILYKGIVSQKEKNNLLKNCSALILPTDFEAFGHVLLEASSFKKPILCSNLEIFSEILNKYGYIGFENNVNGIKQAILKFNEYSEKEKEMMGEMNYINLNRYTTEKITASYNDLFNKLLKKK